MKNELFFYPDDLEKVPDDQMIWRFMDFGSFVFLLSTNQLHFTRIDNFDDPFEGSIPKKIADEYDKHWEEPDELSLEYVGSRENLSKIQQLRRKTIFVNCWHMNNTESAAMWNLYGRNNGIAIQSTVKRLKDSFDPYYRPQDRMFLIPQVKYINYEKDSFNQTHLYNFYLHKRESFRHETELRIMIYYHEIDRNIITKTDEDFPPHIQMKVKLETLIENVFVHPTGKDWFLDAVASVMQKYDVHVDPQRSSIDNNPVY